MIGCIFMCLPLPNGILKKQLCHLVHTLFTHMTHCKVKILIMGVIISGQAADQSRMGTGQSMLMMFITCICILKHRSPVQGLLLYRLQSSPQLAPLQRLSASLQAVITASSASPRSQAMRNYRTHGQPNTSLTKRHLQLGLDSVTSIHFPIIQLVIW